MESNQASEKLRGEIKALVRQGRYDDALHLVEQAQAAGGEAEQEWDAMRVNLVQTRDDLAARLVAQFRSQLDLGAVEQAQQSIVVLSKIQPGHREIAELRAELATMHMVSRRDEARVLAPKSNAEVAHQPSVRTPSEMSTAKDQKDQDSMNGFMDRSTDSELIGTEESGAAIQVQTPMLLMETSLLGLMERLQIWQSMLEKPTAVIPTAKEIHAFRQALAILEETDREAADQLERTLQHRVVSPIITRRKNEVDESLTKLSTLRGGRDTWNDLAERAVQLLEEVSQLTGQEDTEQTDRLRQEPVSYTHLDVYKRQASTSNSNSQYQITLERPLRVMTPRQVTMVDLALAEIGDFGEVRLILQKSRVRFIEKLQSMDAPL